MNLDEYIKKLNQLFWMRNSNPPINGAVEPLSFVDKTIYEKYVSNIALDFHLALTSFSVN